MSWLTRLFPRWSLTERVVREWDMEGLQLRHPPSRAKRRRTWKRFIDRVERERNRRQEK